MATSWERLRGLLEERREFLSWREQVEAPLRQWQARPVNYLLLESVGLEEARRWRRERAEELTEAERRFIDASEEHHKQAYEEMRVKFAHRRRLQRQAAVAAFAALLILVIFIGISRRRSAQVEATIQAATQQIDSGDYRNAIQMLDRLQSTDATDWRAFALRGRAKLLANDLEGSERDDLLASVRVLGAPPLDQFRLFRDRAYFHRVKRDWVLAINDLSLALSVSAPAGDSGVVAVGRQTTIALLRDRAYARSMLEEWNLAIEDLTAALSLVDASIAKDTTIALRSDRAYAYCWVGDLDFALADYEALVRLSGDTAAVESRDALAGMLASKSKSPVPFFVITSVGPSDQNHPGVIPPQVARLQPRLVDFVNLKFWWYPIGNTEVRYTSVIDRDLADRMVYTLRTDRFRLIAHSHVGRIAAPPNRAVV